MNVIKNPTSVHVPVAPFYSHSVIIEPGSEIMYIAGQIGVNKEGIIVEGIESQLDQAWKNTFAILKDGGMSATDIVKVTVYLADGQYADHYAASCEKHLGNHHPAMTAAIVDRLWVRELFFEFDVVAAKKK